MEHVLCMILNHWTYFQRKSILQQQRKNKVNSKSRCDSKRKHSIRKRTQQITEKSESCRDDWAMFHHWPNISPCYTYVTSFTNDVMHRPKSAINIMARRRRRRLVVGYKSDYVIRRTFLINYLHKCERERVSEREPLTNGITWNSVPFFLPLSHHSHSLLVDQIRFICCTTSIQSRFGSLHESVFQFKQWWKVCGYRKMEMVLDRPERV